MEDKTCKLREFERAWEGLNRNVLECIKAHDLEFGVIEIDNTISRSCECRVNVHLAGCKLNPASAKNFASAVIEVSEMAENFKYNGYRIG